MIGTLEAKADAKADASTVTGSITPPEIRQ
jgi:hypothetical protein